MEFLLMLLVVALYTVCSLNDKYAVSRCKMSGSRLTFLMAAGTAFFMAFTLPFTDTYITLSWQSALAILLIVLSKMLEFQMAGKILITMSAFELKAWNGVVLFLSYLSDVLLGEEVKLLRILCIALTAPGLVLIATVGKRKVNYREIALWLILYILGKFLYGVVMQQCTPYISSQMTLFIALVLLAVILIPAAKPMKIVGDCAEGRKGIIIILLCKLPNVFGLYGENKLCETSLANWAFITPMILVVMFIAELIKPEEGERPGKLSLLGSVICILGVIGFQWAAAV
ncbi:MAG: hypothetical protein LIO69_01730 [Oscillospiraceae bacterium]|nr:hypothetical protein [Oscillospiraceae bacterium]